jgi:hypothetical protein
MEWVMFYTQSEALDTQAIVEIVLIETDRNNKKKTYGVGYAVLRVFLNELPVSVEIFKGTPRDVIKMSDPGFEPTKAGCILYFDFK